MLVLLLAAGLQAATPADAVIIGRVVNAVTQQPVRGAIVSTDSVSNDRGTYAFLTGIDGRFVLRGVAPGTVQLEVMKTGYVTREFRSQRAIAAGERMEDVELPVWPGAVISGTVVESGVPAPGVTVTATPREKAPPGSDMQARTDEDGSYSLGGLMAGEYVVTGRGSRTGGAQTTSATVTVGIGEERSGVDLTRSESTEAAPSDPMREPLAGRGSGFIAGRVLDAQGRAVARADVSLTLIGPKSSSSAVTTDGSGSFSFSSLPEGQFVVSATRAGYLGSSGAGLSGSSSASVQLINGGRQEDIVLTLSKGATVSGTVLDEYGDPIAASVIAMRLGTTRLGLSRIGTSGQRDGLARMMALRTTVSARGRYRIGPLLPGEYHILVEPALAETMLHVEDAAGNERTVAMMPTTFPGTVTVLGDADLSGIDVTVTPEPVMSLEVTVTTDGQPTFGAQVQVHELSSNGEVVFHREVSMTGADTATVEPLRPGRYRLIASSDAGSPGAERLRRWATTEVTVGDTSPAAVTMALQPGARISGRVVVDANVKQNQPAIVVRIVPTAGDIAGAGGVPTQEATGAFSIEGILPGTYALQPTAPPSSRYMWFPKSAMHQGRDLFDVPLELTPGVELDNIVVTLTDRVSELSGLVTDSKARPVSDAEVMIFAADARFWWPGSRRVQRVVPDISGRYIVYGLPPGDYLVAVIRNKGEKDLAALLAGLQSTADRVTLTEGGQAVQNIVVGTG